MTSSCHYTHLQNLHLLLHRDTTSACLSLRTWMLRAWRSCFINCLYLPTCFCLHLSVSQDLDVEGFEELFKTKAQGPAVDLTLSRQKLPQKAPSKVSLLEANRAKNLAITLRKAGQGSEVICRAIHT